MTPPLFLVPDLGSGDVIVLTGAEAHHAGTVKRLAVGEAALLADGRGGLAEVVVLEVGRDRVSFTVQARRQLPEPSPRLVVVQALPKGERADLAVEALTELGADEIVPWSASRSVAVWRGDKAARGLAKWQRTALEAAKQSRRARVPVVASLADTDAVAERVASAEAAYVLDSDAELAFATIQPPVVGAVLLVVGPEGGVTPDELALFEQHGAVPVRLGPEVLRTSTAGAAALAVLSVAAGRWH
ncbi:MAG TPA: 16S rRNA (uracil(1498)-N(3))-methyltransferase [Jatrophihabitans sp.]|nr:16S rRNA (uracil(1498)-N(3))-methyltransferase [Jatrophihabitans sp.]